MQFQKYISDRVRCEYAKFTETGCRTELHAILTPEDSGGGIVGQTEKLAMVLSSFMKTEDCHGANPVFMRVFLSDAANQADKVRTILSDFDVTISMIGQTPMYEGVKIVMLVLLVSDSKTIKKSGGVSVDRGSYKDLWIAGLGECNTDSYVATTRILGNYSSILGENGLTMEKNCVRTWFFVNDIDNRYSGLVRARNEFFSACGMTPDSHFIASTGIGGKNARHASVVTFDGLAISGLEREQIIYLKARDYLNPTHEYGVAFERGTAIIYGDRRHLIISGTASINNLGEIVGANDVMAQMERMAENVGALLEEGGGTSRDIAHIIMYIRDIADSGVMKDFVKERYPDIPCVIVQAPVCRPGWLVEMECMAIVGKGDPKYADY